ncbi:MAG: hypothetical protein AAF304_07315 [Pseudomonadota bacterium]
MKAIEIRVNGELKATCCDKDVTKILASVSVEIDNSNNEYEIECFGIKPLSDSKKEVLRWVGALVNEDDEISFKFVDSEKSYEPIDRQEIDRRG